mmetsp:Transcript_9365/g.15513  ORF Transcript_9365/g.15513 Transcript_9365/m.15513 type:complete len:94 (-) Transcript_9365:181-462(-)
MTKTKGARLQDSAGNTLGNTLAVAPTGAGKMIMLSAVLRRMFDRDIENSCIPAHRVQLNFQNESKLIPDFPPEFSMRMRKAGMATFAMVQTLS